MLKQYLNFNTNLTRIRLTKHIFNSVNTSITRQYISKHGNTELISLNLGRGLLSIQGPDSIKFLNGMSTNLVTLNEKDTPNCQYNAFLTPQGRVMFDSFIYQNKNNKDSNPSFFMDYPMEQKETILSHLKKYKLIAKVHIKEVSNEFDLFQLSEENKIESEINDECIINEDPRLKLMGKRCIIPKGEKGFEAYIKKHSIELQDYGSYKLKLLTNGIAETNLGILPMTSLPMESNLELLNGIHFRKGCYIGQELTIRTHHKGVIRKRLFSIKVLEQEINHLDLINYDIFLSETSKKSVGKIMYQNQNQLIVLFRLNHIPKQNENELEAIIRGNEKDIKVKLKFIIPQFMKPVLESLE
ncbi:Aminomethyltransferase folate-binding domain-containing protein [Neoconidiobolus thromboides FSU 785]|nr:Aminomethyltransferase folate-binding domain-containing protein [Neoconidiobolus thromboides FSU 785]